MFQKTDKDTFRRLAAILLAVSVALLALSVLTESRDGRRQILDHDGGTEEQL